MCLLPVHMTVRRGTGAQFLPAHPEHGPPEEAQPTDAVASQTAGLRHFGITIAKTVLTAGSVPGRALSKLDVRDEH